MIEGLEAFEKRGFEEFSNLFNADVTEYDFSNYAMNLVPEQFFTHRSTVEKFVFPETIQSIGVGAFDDCAACTVYDFSKCKQVPTFSGISFNNIKADAKIIVPDALYDEWITTGNWTGVSAHIVKESEA